MRAPQFPAGSEGGAERIVDVDRIERIFRALSRVSAAGRVVENGVTLGLVTPLSKPGAIEGTIRWAHDGPPWVGRKTVEIAGPLSLYRFALEFGNELDGGLETAIPHAVERVRTRRGPRVKPPHGVVVRYRGRDGRPIVRNLADVSSSGLAFLVSARDAVLPGAEIVNVVVDWQGRLRICARLLVCHVSEQLGEGPRVAGALIFFDSPEDAQHWEAEVVALIHPTTRTEATWTRDLWELYEHSGYFSLSNKTPDDFAHLRGPFGDASSKLARSPDLGVQVIWPSGRGVEASASVVALNDEAVFLYHVARRHGIQPVGVTGPMILHDVYRRALQWISSHDFARWLVVWVQEAGRFSKRTHLDFVARQVDDTKASVVEFRALEVRVRGPNDSQTRLVTSATSSHRAQGKWTIRVARAGELAQVAAASAARFPPSFCAAHALNFPLHKRTFQTRWDQSSLRRCRQVVVAECEGRLEAAAIIECAKDGVHLFGLLDVVRTVPIGPAAEEATAALLAHARKLFDRLGKAVFIWACDAEVPEEQWPANAVDLGLTYCTVMSAELLPHFAEHVWEQTIGAAN